MLYNRNRKNVLFFCKLVKLTGLKFVVSFVVVEDKRRAASNQTVGNYHQYGFATLLISTVKSENAQKCTQLCN